MKRYICAISAVLLLTAFQAAPVFAGGENTARQAYTHSPAYASGTRETPTAPFGFSPAPPSRQAEMTGNRAATVQASNTPVRERPTPARLASATNTPRTPYGFSPAPPWTRQERVEPGNERVTGYASVPPMPPNEKYGKVSQEEDTGEAPMGFFPQQRACPSRRC